MKAKYKITQIERNTTNPFGERIVKILVNEPIEEKSFYLNGIPHIVGQHRRFNGRFWEMELMPIQGIKEMHLHDYWNGICHLCGIYKVCSQEVMEL